MISFIWNNWQLILIALGGVIGFAALAYFMRNWRAAVAAVVIVVAVFGYGAVWKYVYDQIWEEIAAAQEKVLQDHIAALEASNEELANQKVLDDEALAKLLDDISKTPKNPKECLPEDATGRIDEVK